MGYTHYWTRKEDEIPLTKWKKFIRRFGPIVKAHKAILQDIELTDEMVFFNGAHETFVVERIACPKEWLNGKHFSFCKTAAKDYDPVVVAGLILLATILKGDPVGFSWSSDGRRNEHDNGLALTGLTREEAVGATSDD